MDEEDVQLVVSAVARGFQDAEGVVSELGAAAGKLAQQFNQDASGALQVFGVNLNALNNPITALATGLKSSIDEAAQWGQTIDKLSRASGENATETSKMAVVLGDYGINVDGLDRTVKAFTKNGLQFNLDTLKSLSQQYQAIQDPVERDKFAFDNFGRSALDMTEILSKTPDQLNAIGDAAMYSGKIMDEQGVQAAQNFSVKLAQLSDKADGLKIAIGGPLIDVLSNAMDGFKGLVGTINAADILFERNTGLISQNEAVARANAAAQGDLFAAFHDANTALAEGDPLYATYLQQQKQMKDALDAEANSAVSAASLIAEYTGNVNLQIGTQLKAVDAQKAYNDSLQQTADALSDQAVAAGVAATVTKNEQTYQNVLAGNAPKIAELRGEIAKWTAAQGQNVTVVTEGKYSTEQLGVAQDRLAIAQEKLAAGHYKTKAALDAATLSVRTAQDAVDNITGHMATASSTTADYSSKIAAAEKELNGLTGANDDAAVAMHNANKEWVAQQAMAGLHGQALLEAARAAGVLSEQEYNLATQVQTAKDQFVKTGDENAYAAALHTIGQEADGVIDPIHQLPYEIIPAGKAAADATVSIDGMADAMNKLPRYTEITIQTDYINKTYGPGGVGHEPPGGANGLDMIVPSWAPHAANGMDAIVPAGYPNDSFPIMAQSGERVVIIPPGQPGNGRAAPSAAGGQGEITNVYINDRLATALYLEQQRQRRLWRMELRMR